MAKEFKRPATPDTVGLIYGSGGIGKSTLIADAAAFIWKEFGKKTRIIGADGGGTANAVRIGLDAGFIEYMPVDQWDERSIFSTLDLVTKGHWPSDAAVPNSPLEPPVKEWKPCPACGGDSGAKGFAMVAACASCKKPFPAGKLLSVRRDPINGFDEIGLVAFEGLTSFGELLLRRLRKSDPAGGYSIQDQDFKVTAPGQPHYGLAQAYLAQFVTNVRSIPVPVVLWTALELRGEEDGKPLYGPKGPGRALTSACIPWFTDVLHLDAVARRLPSGALEKSPAGLEVLDRKLYLAPHFPSDAPAFRFAAKTSAPLGGDMPLVIEPSMRTFFEELEKAFEKARKKVLG